jgi:hypothetical protein
MWRTSRKSSSPRLRLSVNLNTLRTLQSVWAWDKAPASLRDRQATVDASVPALELIGRRLSDTGMSHDTSEAHPVRVRCSAKT